MLLTLIVFLVILSVLVLVHEFGHFLVAKFFGIGAEEFALGLPFTKPLFSKRLPDGMKVSVYPVLFGGFVKLLGEESDSKSAKSFRQKNVWQRIAVVVAGVTANVILAIFAFYLFLAFSRFRVLVPKLADASFLSPHQTLVVISSVQKDSPAEKGKLTPGDVVLTADGQKFPDFKSFQAYTKKQAGKEIRLVLVDTNLENQKQVVVTPRENPPAGQGPLGIGISEAVAIEYQTAPEKAVSGAAYGADMLNYNIRVIGELGIRSFKTKTIEPLSENISGPVGIAGAVGTILEIGGSQVAAQLLNLLGLLSLSLAFMNILPFPALDGGKLAFLLVEAATGKKLPEKYENIINQAGMGLLLILIFLISAILT